MQFWRKAERVVQYKQQVVSNARKKEVMDKHLDFLVGQTQRYSTLLAQRLAGKPWSSPFRLVGGPWSLPFRLVGGAWSLPFRLVGGHRCGHDYKMGLMVKGTVQASNCVDQLKTWHLEDFGN